MLLLSKSAISYNDQLMIIWFSFQFQRIFKKMSSLGKSFLRIIVSSSTFKSPVKINPKDKEFK